jgi:hypothetical protein
MVVGPTYKPSALQLGLDRKQAQKPDTELTPSADFGFVAVLHLPDGALLRFDELRKRHGSVSRFAAAPSRPVNAPTGIEAGAFQYESKAFPLRRGGDSASGRAIA